MGNHQTRGIVRITNTKFHCCINLRIKLRNQSTNLPCPWLALKHLKGSCVLTLPPKLTVSIFGAHMTTGWKWGHLIGSHSFRFIWYYPRFVLFHLLFVVYFSLLVLTRICSQSLWSQFVCVYQDLHVNLHLQYSCLKFKSPFHSIPFCPIPLHPIPFHSIPPFHSILFHPIPFHCILFHGNQERKTVN